MTQDLSKLQRLVEEMKQEQAMNAEQEKILPTGLEDAHKKGSVSEPDPFIAYMKGLSAQEALQKLTTKHPKPQRLNLRDGNKFRCPHIDHEDNNPSAWIKPESREWYCAACESGGDWTELAAATFGFRTSRGWNDKKAEWPDFIDKMKGFLGWEDPKPDAIDVKKLRESTIKGVSDGPPMPSVESPQCQINWRKILPEHTFLRTWMEEVTKDDSPEEYHLVNGLIALSLALGLDVGLVDAPRVYGNLFVCVLGDSGSGKSKSGRLLKELLHQGLPYDEHDATNKGAYVVSSPASGEVLYKLFSKPIHDPNDDKKVLFYASVRGLVDYPELAGLVSRSNRQASTVKATLIDLFDNPPTFSTVSLTRGTLYAEKPFGCMLTTTQPGVIQDMFARADDRGGFLNRIIFVRGTHKEPFSINKVKIDVGNAAVMLRDVFLWTQDEFTGDEGIEWSPEAERLWDQFFRHNILPDKEKSQNDLLNRIDLLMKKLILLFTANKKLKVVPIESVRDAMECYEYFTATYGFTGAELIKTSGTELEDKVLKVVKKIFLDGDDKELVEPEKWPTPRDIVLKISPRVETSKVKDALRTLSEAGFLQVWTPPKGKVGRPTIRYAPNEG